jgi:precorrin-6B methylase 2
MRLISAQAACTFLITLLTAASIAPAVSQTTNSAPTKKPDVIFVPTRHEVVAKMLELAEIKPGDVLYDLGCGDGRIVVAAAKKYGIKAIGVDIDPQRIKESQENVRTNKVGHLVTIKQADIFELDFSDATVVTMYLLPDLNVKLMPKLAKLKPGTRIVSNDFDMRGAKPKEVVNVQGEYGDNSGSQHTVYKWVVPWEEEK